MASKTNIERLLIWLFLSEPADSLSKLRSFGVSPAVESGAFVTPCYCYTDEV